MSPQNPRYTEEDIVVLEGLEPVRKRPGMYIGGVDSRGYHHLLWEILDNAIDEVINGHATTIKVIAAPRSALGHRRGQRAWHSDRHPSQVRQERARGHLDDASLGRKVRARQLHSLGRSPRRRRFGRQRAVVRAAGSASVATAKKSSKRTSGAAPWRLYAASVPPEVPAARCSSVPTRRSSAKKPPSTSRWCVSDSSPRATCTRDCA
jgi:hypothetical protein